MSAVWSRLLAATWVLVAVAHGFTSVASRRTGKPLWWVDEQGFAGTTTPVLGAGLVYLSMLVVFVVALRHARHAPLLSLIVSVGLGGVAAADLGATPGSAAVSLATAGAAFVASLAALAGRDPH